MPDDKEEFTEKVSLKVWDAKQKVFRKQQDDLDAYRKVVDKKDVIVVGGKFAVGTLGTPSAGSEIIDKDGKVYVVDKVTGPRPFICYVTPKKKPD